MQLLLLIGFDGCLHQHLVHALVVVGLGLPVDEVVD